VYDQYEDVGPLRFKFASCTLGEKVNIADGLLRHTATAGNHMLRLSRRACIFVAHGPSKLYRVAGSQFHTKITPWNDDQKLGLLAMREQGNWRPNEPRQRDRRGPHTICCIRPQGDTTSFDLFRHIIKQQPHWAAISQSKLSFFYS
jgi:hypothetical protein